jgi:hypothetical protein
LSLKREGILASEIFINFYSDTHHYVSGDNENFRYILYIMMKLPVLYDDAVFDVK